MTMTETREHKRTIEVLHCMAVIPVANGHTGICGHRAVMTWHGVPFCPTHAPAKRPGIAGWALL